MDGSRWQLAPDVPQLQAGRGRGRGRGGRGEGEVKEGGEGTLLFSLFPAALRSCRSDNRDVW